MANQIQFIQLSQAEYDNISSKNDGSLYFTTDTHRIYKGGDLYASTTFDSLKFEDLSATSIKVDGKDVSLEGHTHNVDELDGWKDVELEFGSIEAEEIKVNDQDVSVVGHKHTTADIEGIENIKTGAEVQLKIPSQSLDKTIDKLVVNKLTQSEYDSLKSNGRLNDEELYFVDSNVLDASGNTIPNVATPINATDAATKGYVDTQVEQVRQDIVGIETRVENNVTEYVEQMISEQIGQVLTQEEF